MEQANNIQQLAAAPSINNIPSISSSAMLVEFGFSIWGTKKQDKTATKAIANGTGADTESVEGRKDIMRSDKLTAIRKFAANARNQIHYRLTLPWSDMGLRLLPTAALFDYQQAMSEAKQEYWRLVEDFLSDYDFDVSQRQAEAEKLGTLFNSRDYPPTDVLRGKFGWRCIMSHIPEVGDFRLDLQAEAADAIKQQYEDFYTSSIDAAVSDLWQRVRNNLETITRQLSPKDEVDDNGDQKYNKLYQSVFDTSLELIGMMRDCNLTGDTQMAAVTSQLEDALYGVSTDMLKHNETARLDKHREVQKILDNLPSLGM